MNHTPTTAIGNRGEDIASVFLSQQGYSIEDRNWHTRWCEIDIIARRKKCIFFIEVKYRTSHFQGEGYEYVTKKKQKQMQFAAQLWAHQKRYEGDMELLVASVSVDGSVSLYPLM